MGNLSFTVGPVGRTGRQTGGSGVMSSRFRTSGLFTTSTSASFVEDGSGDIEVNPGEFVLVLADTDMWINPTGNAAAVGTGFPLAAGVPFFYEQDPGPGAGALKLSAIDVA